MRLVHAIRTYNVQHKTSVLLVQISTDEVLGDLPLTATHTFDESTAYNPHNVYAVTKAAAEQYIRAMHHTRADFDYIID